MTPTKNITSNKDIRRLIDECRAAGWAIDRTEGGHVVFYCPDKRVRPIYSGGTPSDVRAIRNLRAMLRAATKPR